MPRMRRPTKVLSPALLALLMSAGAQTTTAKISRFSQTPRITFDILSDTRGVQLTPYLGSLVPELQKRFTAASDASSSSLPSEHEAAVLLTIAPDGKLSSLQLEAQDSPTAKHAWQAAKDATYEPLPGLPDVLYQ